MPANRKSTLLICLLLLVILSGGCVTDQPSDHTVPYEQVDDTKLAARTGEIMFSTYDGRQWNELLVKGVNIGTSLPGRWYTEFPADRELYRRWLEEIAAMNANTVRLYTLLDPPFYAVFYEYNSEPGNQPLWLIQEIWPHDEVPDLNLYDSSYAQAYRSEIELTIDALHGNADIPGRPYRAYGNYSVDISPYLLAILVGRELEPEEVGATNQANPELDRFSGQFVSTTGPATATEIWLADMCNHVLNYSQQVYGWQYPVGFVSWPTLDPLTHPTEWEADGTPGYNDRETIDPNIFTVGEFNRAGFFGAYHIYPNYPDFMNNEPLFAEYEDVIGVFRYRGYLDQFMAVHPPYPALVAEFGISTSLNTAHLNPDGLHHGGLTEADQGEIVVRMMRSIVEKNYAGGIIFEWSDEWAKKTWNTEPFMVPWERQVLWHNAMCPEQNYGILAVEPQQRLPEDLLYRWHTARSAVSYNPVDGANSSFGKIRAINLGADEAFLYLAVDVNTLNSDGIDQARELGLVIGIDVGNRESGEFMLPLSATPLLPTGVEFLLHISLPDIAELLVIPSYNRGLLNFDPQPGQRAEFERIITLVNRERITADNRQFPALFSDESTLVKGDFHTSTVEYNSLAHWYREAENGLIIVRLPWMLLNVSDPSQLKIIRDAEHYLEYPLRDQLQVEETAGFLFYAATYSRYSDTQLLADHPAAIDFEPRLIDAFDQSITPYRWNGWEEPHYSFRLKDSYQIIADYFGELN